MVHPFFQKIRDISPNFEEQFLSWFEVIFVNDNENIDSWLDAVAEAFSYPTRNEDAFITDEFARSETQFLLDNGFEQREIDTYTNAVMFWCIIRRIHQSLHERQYGRNDNIFAFMISQNIQHVKMIILGQDPRKNVPSFGFAFNRDASDSTRLVIDFLAQELVLLTNEELPEIQNMVRFTDNELIALRGVDGEGGSCDLDGWVQQNVLMMNPLLTYGIESPESDGWKMITNFFVRHISSVAQANETHLVIMFAGNVAFEKATLVDPYHLKLRLFHPGAYRRKNFMDYYTREKDWAVILPFINANFYLYQQQHRVTEGLVDWIRISGDSPNRGNERTVILGNIFQQILEFAENISDADWVNPIIWRGRIVVRRLEPNIYCLERSA